MKSTLSRTVRRALLPAQRGKTVYVTLGNSLRGDDGVAGYIAENLRIQREDIVVIRAENKPEGIMDQVVKAQPAKTIIIDAVDFSEEAGMIRSFDDSRISGMALSTHRLTPSIIAAILKEDTRSEVLFVGIQIQQTTYGSPIGEQVKKSADKIIDFLNSRLGNRMP